MKMRKLWALLLAVVMVCGLFAGCQKSDANPSTNPRKILRILELNLSLI